MAGDMGISIALQILFKQPRTHICPAGYESLAVIPTGDIFPCHILVDKDEFVMGNISDEHWYNSFSAQNVYRMLKHARKEENPYCSQCWARYICAGCLGGWEPDGANQVFISEVGCDIKRTIWDTIIRKTVELKDNPAAWEKIEQYLAKILDEKKRRQVGREQASNLAPQQLVQIQGRRKEAAEEFARPVC
jgi:radical SAM protein with 4Fe4S-binding SPASM domain